MASHKSFGTGSSEKADVEPSATRSTESFAANITRPDSHETSTGASSSHDSHYRTIVADPPWPYPDDKRGWGVGVGEKSWRNSKQRVKSPYPSMTLGAIRELPVASLADDAAHLYLWTTNRHLHEAFHVADAWGFRHAQTLVWAKTPIGSFLGGAFGANVEFVLFCRRGTLATKSSLPTSWFTWERVGAGSHSRKPEGFLDIVEGISPGPYLELFARRQRLGWDTWGNEALEHVELAV